VATEQDKRVVKQQMEAFFKVAGTTPGSWSGPTLKWQHKA
jgi:hypothetical protein